MTPETRPENRVSKQRFRERVPELREQLLEAQFDHRARGDGALLLILAGPDRDSKTALGSRLGQWLDMRFVDTLAFEAPDCKEREMPWLWRYWQVLPAKGRSALLYGSWYNDVLVEALDGPLDAARLEIGLRRINAFERMLCLEGIRIVKVWLASDGQSSRGNGSAGGDVHWLDLGSGDADWRPVTEACFRITSTGHAPWVAVDGDDARTRDLTVGEIVLEVMAKGAAGAADQPVVASPVLDRPRDETLSLMRFEAQEPLAEEKYEQSLAKYQKKLAKQTGSRSFAKHGVLLVFEGVDAAGKGGTIRRIGEALDPRLCSVHQYGPPNAEERRYPYLWRFWRTVPGPGRIAIFDRSYYGRVLVERIEGLCSPAEWGRAYGEIAEFEQQLLRAGIVVRKFWLAISKEEQLRRFEARATTPWKRHKITDEDWRNREKWDEYEHAVVEMIQRTQSEAAPWTIVDSNDKRRARIEVLKRVSRALEELGD